MSDTICRSCHISKTSMVSLLLHKVENELLKDIFYYCTTIKILEEELLPQNICKSCLELLIVSYKFIKKCQENDQKLRLEPNEKEWNNCKLSPEINVDSCTNSCEALCKTENNKIIKTKLQCDLCGKTFTKKSSLVYHFRIHSGQKDFKCPECDYSFSTSSQLSVHQRSHYGYKPHVCKICSKKFSKSSNLKIHLLIHENKKRFTCNVCSKNFSQKAHLLTHQNLHIGFKPFSCYCGASFVTETNLKRHGNIHKEVRNYLCYICGSLFTSSNDLNRHLEGHTDKKKVFTCNICSKEFTRLTSLQRHTNKVHN